MKNRFIYIAGLLICLLLLFLSAICFFIPRAVTLTLPNRWQHIPLNQPRTAVVAWLGKPAKADTLHLAQNGDTWKVARKNGEYYLNIQYELSMDTLANKYSIDFVYHLFYFKKVYHIHNEVINPDHVVSL